MPDFARWIRGSADAPDAATSYPNELWPILEGNACAVSLSRIRSGPQADLLYQTSGAISNLSAGDAHKYPDIPGLHSCAVTSATAPAHRVPSRIFSGPAQPPNQRSSREDGVKQTNENTIDTRVENDR